jgi:hypothetical protein
VRNSGEAWISEIALPAKKNNGEKRKVEEIDPRLPRKTTPLPRRERENPKISHPHNRKNEERKDSPTKKLPASTAVCGPGVRVQRSRRERADIGAVALEGKPRVVVLVVLRLGFRHAFVRSVAILVLWYW